MDAALAQLAEMLKQKQSAIARPGVHIASTPPPLPAFGMPGQTAANSLPSMASYMASYMKPQPEPVQPTPAPAPIQQVPLAPPADPTNPVVVPPMPDPINVGTGGMPSARPDVLAAFKQLLQAGQFPEQMAANQYRQFPSNS